MAKSILIVDDEANIRELYKQEFEEEGYRVTTVASAEEASDILRGERPDLLVLDIEMPGRDGLSYLREVIERDRDLPVLINSAYSCYRDDFSSWLAAAYVVKSADLGPLKGKIREILADSPLESLSRLPSGGPKGEAS
jgi:DNA-binding response OmpR family regulator